ncbi:MAG: Gfo/Idh/MocA family oxidoreductase [Dehalococcoidia bacterium]|nr:Gfo/Idh/MocA family oxidoreductase [Dehalococcoidia bacterium]
MTTSNDRPLRVGVLGVGFGSVVHLPAFISEGWEVPAVWSRRRERAEEAAAKHGIGEVADDWRDLVARDDLDAIAVATPPLAHHEMTLAALEAGKHVLCEKPFALDAGQARAMRDLARAQGLVGMVAHEFRYAPQRSYIKQLIEEGRIGTPQLVTAELFLGRAAPATPPPVGASVAEGAGFLGGLGSHFIDGLRHWFGDVEAVTGTTIALRPDRTDASGHIVQVDVDDAFTFALRFRSGVLATMTASSAVSPGSGGRVMIAGSEGVLVATQRGPNPEPDGVVLFGRSTDRGLEELPMPSEFRPFDDQRDHRLMAFRLLVREFERGIRTGAEVTPSFDDGVGCQTVLDAVRESSRTGRRVEVAL